MEIETRAGNIYSYDRWTGEILAGSSHPDRSSWVYAPQPYFDELPDVDSFLLGLTEQCNLRCTYCCYSGSYSGKRTHGPKSMCTEDIDEIFDFIGSFTSRRPIKIFMYGGEPLLKHPVVQYVVEKGRERWGGCVDFTLSCNGTTLTHERIDWLVSNKVVIALSIDGTKDFHDLYRKDAKGEGSYSKVYDAISYIKKAYPEYIKELVLIMTVASFDKFPGIAEAWHADPVLSDLSPTMINSLAPNFNTGVPRADYDVVKGFFDSLLDLYEQHPDWILLSRLLELCVSSWKDRPIFTPSGSVPMPTCMPTNTKLYIDSSLQIGVCEKISDQFRIGDVRGGIDWESANAMVQQYYEQRKERCTCCPAVRMCNMCLTAIEHTDEQWDLLCHNERVYMQVYMYLFCEMAERGLL